MSQITTGLLDALQSIVEGSNDSGNAPVMMMLGTFKFSLNTAVFKQMDIDAVYRWATIERTGDYSAKQFTGFGDETISLPGVIYPDYRGDAGQVTALKALASQGAPQRLINAAGQIAGYWVITNIRESRQVFNPDGTFRKQEFTVGLEFYGTNLS